MKPGIIEFEGPIAISNVMLVCPKCDQATRVAPLNAKMERASASARTAAAID